MSRTDKRRWHPNDRAALLIALPLASALLALGLTGHGPWDQQGCRTVTVKTEVVKEVVTQLTRGLHLDLESSDGRIVMYGAVASEGDRKALVEAASANFGPDNVVDRMSVDAAVSPIAWLPSAKDLLQRLKDLGAGARFKIDGSTLTVQGVVTEEALKDRAPAEALALLGAGARLENDLIVRKPPPPPEVAQEAPPPVPAAAPAPIPAPAPHTVAAGPPPPPAAPPLAGGLVRHTLPNGIVIEVAPDGVEQKCIAFIEDAATPIDKNLWFEFDRLQFEIGSAALTAQSKAQVTALAEVLKAYPHTAIKIGGYADTTGDSDFNMKLSTARADRVVKELIALGIGGGRLESEGYGTAHPVGDNATAEGRAQNRRTAVSVRRK